MLDPDYALILGIFLILLAIPSLLSALADKRRPITAIALATIGGGMLWWASSNTPGGYRLPDVPMVFLEVVSRVLN